MIPNIWKNKKCSKHFQTTNQYGTILERNLNREITSSWHVLSTHDSFVWKRQVLLRTRLKVYFSSDTAIVLSHFLVQPGSQDVTGSVLWDPLEPKRPKTGSSRTIQWRSSDPSKTPTQRAYLPIPAASRALDAQPLAICELGQSAEANNARQLLVAHELMMQAVGHQQYQLGQQRGRLGDPVDDTWFVINFYGMFLRWLWIIWWHTQDHTVTQHGFFLTSFMGRKVSWHRHWTSLPHPQGQGEEHSLTAQNDSKWL